MANINRLRKFVQDLTVLVDMHGDDEPALVAKVESALGALVSVDDWLPEAFAEPMSKSYAQYLLHCDPLERVSVVSFVWGPGQATPIHDHTVWGVIGVLRGEEASQPYSLSRDAPPVPGEEKRMRPGDIEVVSPRVGDIHKVSNALEDRPSISIHIYGGNIGAVRRHVFDEENSAAREFISGYASPQTPNLWDRSG